MSQIEDIVRQELIVGFSTHVVLNNAGALSLVHYRVIRNQGGVGLILVTQPDPDTAMTLRNSVLGQVCSSGGGLMEAWDRGVFCELGQGTAGLDPFLDALKARGYKGWITVEQDRFLKPDDTAEALLALHTRNRDWLTARGF
jgi:hypothetical protein